MERTKAFAMKAVMTFVLMYLILGLVFGLSFWNILLITVILGVLSYPIGDLLILPKSSNIVATLADFGMAFIIIWLYGLAFSTLDAGTMALAALMAAFAMGIGEFFFHMYILRKNLGTAPGPEDTRIY